MIELQTHKDLTVGLIARCDVCGETVTGSHANLLFPAPPREEAPPLPLPYRIACKGSCTYAVDQKHGRQDWMDLDTAIGSLLNNTRIDLDQVHRKMGLLACLG